MCMYLVKGIGHAYITICMHAYMEQDVVLIEHQLKVQWVLGSIPHDGPIEIFLVPDSALQLV